MATVTLGNIKLNWKGAYNAGTAYAIDDVVSYNGSSYVAKTATTGNLPTVTANWDIMSQAGTNGTNGTDLTSTLTTQGDIVYRDGSGLARLGYGTAGQVLKTGGSGANPSWGNVTSSILQMKSVSTGVQFSTNTTTWTGTSATEYTPVTLTITPTSATSLLKVEYSFMATHAGDYQGMYWCTYNHSGISETAVENDDTYGCTHGFDRGSAENVTSQMATGIAGAIYLDPQTTNAVTIKHRFATTNSSHSTYINRTAYGNGANDSFAGICTVTISEIASGIITHTKGANINGD
tara:strand:- start:483 stop:1358 length:876 start_codon:yes stop_codon:yes gene_type:complete